MDTFSTEIARTIQHLVSRWVQADRAALRALFPLLAEGKPISPARVSRSRKKDALAVEKVLTMVRADRDSCGNVIGLFGLTLLPTWHRILIEEVALFSCCAMVAQMAPGLTGRSAVIESIDPINNRVVRISVSPNSIQSVEPGTAVATFVVTRQEDVLRDVSSAFCSHVRHFISESSALEFTRLNPRRYIVPIVQLQIIADRVRESIWS